MHGDATGTFTFNYLQIQSALASGRMVLAPSVELWLFLAFFLAFAVKVPLFPFHTWLPDAHVEAPTAGSVLLAGVLLKMGTYGLARFNLPLFPHISHLLAPLISMLAIVGIIYGALVAMVQPDLKKLVAYSSVSHLGFIVLGIFSFNVQGMEGAIYQMLNHEMLGMEEGPAIENKEDNATEYPYDSRGFRFVKFKVQGKTLNAIRFTDLKKST